MPQVQYKKVFLGCLENRDGNEALVLHGEQEEESSEVRTKSLILKSFWNPGSIFYFGFYHQSCLQQ